MNSGIHNVVVIGASAGGMTAVGQILTGLPSTINACVMAVLHLSEDSNSNYIAGFFQKQTPLTCIVPSDGEIIRSGNFYLAPTDHQMTIKDGIITLSSGSRENRYRPSIDVLFRSAAVNYGSRVTGIILTGLLDDGTSGMSAIKRSGGRCIVQDPSDAQFSEMPKSVINYLDVDYKVKLDEIGPLLRKILAEPVPGHVQD